MLKSYKWDWVWVWVWVWDWKSLQALILRALLCGANKDGDKNYANDANDDANGDANDDANGDANGWATIIPLLWQVPTLHSPSF